MAVLQVLQYNVRVASSLFARYVPLCIVAILYVVGKSLYSGVGVGTYRCLVVVFSMFSAEFCVLKLLQYPPRNCEKTSMLVSAVLCFGNVGNPITRFADISR